MKILGTLLLFVAVSAQGQITTIPPNPVAGVAFAIHVITPPCSAVTGPAVVNGTTIDIDVTFGSICGTFPPGVFDVPAGPLPAGNYTVQLHNANNGGTVFATQPIVVNATDIPAIDSRLLALLAVMLAALGLRFAAR